MSDAEHVDYAIIGGGISGVYSAWRLKQCFGDKKSVAVYEHSDRIGGRLLSVKLPDMPNVVAELGGMRYIPASQPLITNLIRELNLPTADFPMGQQPDGDDPGDPAGNDNFAYFRGQHLRVGELADAQKNPYHLSWSERGLSPSGLQRQVMKLLVPEADDLSFNDWFQVKVFGQELWKFGFWNLLYRVLTPEAYEFLKQGSGYDTNVSNGNAVTLLPIGDEFDGSATYRTLVNGMQSLPLTLADRFETQLGGKLHRNFRLASICRPEGSMYRLVFNRTQTEDGQTTDIKPLDLVVRTAEHVILAMPRRSLELVDWPMWTEDRFLRDNLASVLVQSAFKMVLGYRYPWWREMGLVAGRSLSDLPIRQTLYFGSEADFPESGSNRNSLLMASYNDIGTIPFWKGLENDQAFDDRVAQTGCTATQSMVEEAHKQVELLHNQPELPKPYSAAYHEWHADPYGGGWHSWKAGFKYDDVMDRMRHPVKSEKVYICGSAYSNDQGWAEGALETAEQMLTTDLQLESHGITDNWQPNPLKRMFYR